MKIAIVSAHRFEGRGGMETVITTLIQELTKRGDHVTLISRKGSNHFGWADQFQYHEICSCGGIKAILYCWQLTRLLNSLRPDIILAVDYRSVYYASFYRFLRNNVRIGSWLHGSLLKISSSALSKIKDADFHLAISSGIAEGIKEVVSNSEDIYLVYNPVIPSKVFVPRAKESVFLYIGRLEYGHDKQINQFLRALAKVNGVWEAVIIGDGSDAEQLKELAKQLDIAANITWAGWLQDPWSFVEKASVLVLTSRNEGFPTVLMEALSRGVPCISSACPDGPVDIIEHGQNGWLYPVGDIKMLTSLLQMLVDSPSLLPDQAKVKQSSKKFSVDNVVDNIRNILLQHIEDRG